MGGGAPPPPPPGAPLIFRLTELETAPPLCKDLDDRPPLISRSGSGTGSRGNVIPTTVVFSL